MACGMKSPYLLCCNSNDILDLKCWCFAYICLKRGLWDKKVQFWHNHACRNLRCLVQSLVRYIVTKHSGPQRNMSARSCIIFTFTLILKQGHTQLVIAQLLALEIPPWCVDVCEYDAKKLSFPLDQYYIKVEHLTNWRKNKTIAEATLKEVCLLLTANNYSNMSMKSQHWTSSSEVQLYKHKAMSTEVIYK